CVWPGNAAGRWKSDPMLANHRVVIAMLAVQFVTRSTADVAQSDGRDRHGEDLQPTTNRHWAFQPMTRPAVPEVKGKRWVQTPVDNFILAKLEQHRLAPSPPADKYALLRRVTFDLTGLPPAPDEVEAFVGDKSRQAFARVVDRLLASP